MAKGCCTENECGCDDAWSQGYDFCKAEMRQDYEDAEEVAARALEWLHDALHERGFNVLEAVTIRFDAAARVLVAVQGAREVWLR